MFAPDVVDAPAGAGILNVARDISYYFFQRRRRSGAKIRARDANVGIDVGDGFRLEFGSIGFHPFG